MFYDAIFALFRVFRELAVPLVGHPYMLACVTVNQVRFYSVNAIRIIAYVAFSYFPFKQSFFTVYNSIKDFIL